MYRVYCDGQLLYHSKLENLQILHPSVELEQNKSGSFSFTLPANHPRYGVTRRMKSIITLYQQDYMMFRGRILDESINWYNRKTISCEGDLAFLLDSILRPFAYSGTPAEFLAYILTLHNAQVDAEKQFLPGNVTVDGFVSYDTTEYLSTKETADKALFDALGGYFQTRYENGVAYLDYLAEPTLLSPQKITFGKNLLDLKRTRKGADIATLIVPLGAKLKDEEGNDTGKRLTIESVNGGADFVQDVDAVAQYGIIVKAVTFDDITDAETLKAKGQAQLAESVNLPDSIEVTAADLATTSQNILSFHLNTWVETESKPHGISQRFIVKKLSIPDLFSPASHKMTLNGTVEGLSSGLQGVAAQQRQILQTVEQRAREAAETVYNVERNLLASLQVSADNIQSIVAETYTLKEDAEAMVAAVSTEVEQTKNSVEIQFNQFSQDVAAVAAGADAEFEEIRKYIRFVDGKILLGEVGNELELQIANDRISFLQDGAEVAYFTNRKLYVTDAQFLHSLQLGSFAFMPRENKNLSLKKI